MCVCDNERKFYSRANEIFRMKKSRIKHSLSRTSVCCHCSNSPPPGIVNLFICLTSPNHRGHAPMRSIVFTTCCIARNRLLGSETAFFFFSLPLLSLVLSHVNSFQNSLSNPLSISPFQAKNNDADLSNRTRLYNNDESNFLLFC